MIQAINHFLVRAKETHKKKTKSGVLLVDSFQNQEYANQIFEIESVPAKYKSVAKKGDFLLVHFNLVVYQFGSDKKYDSVYHVKDDIYYVPENMLHAVIDGDTKEFTYVFGEWNIVKPIIHNEDKVTPSGIVYELKKTEAQLKQEEMQGNIVISKELPAGTHVLMEDHADYSFESITGENEKLWLVMNSTILGIIND